MFTAVLVVHIATGATGLIMGPVAMWAGKRRGTHTRVGEIYHWNMLVVCLSAAGLALMDWADAGFLLYVAIFSYAFALVGYVAAKKRWKGWMRGAHRRPGRLLHRPGHRVHDRPGGKRCAAHRLADPDDHRHPDHRVGQLPGGNGQAAEGPHACPPDRQRAGSSSSLPVVRRDSMSSWARRTSDIG